MMEPDAEPGRGAEAQIADFRDRIAQNPGNPAPRNRLATLLHKAGRREEAVAILQETVARFPKNQKAREQLAVLLGRQQAVPVQEPALPPFTLLPPIQTEQAVLTLPVPRGALPPEPGQDTATTLIQAPWEMPISLVRWRPTAEMVASFSILVVLGIAWEAWRLLPESHLLQRPATVVMEAALPATASVVAAALAPIAPVLVQPAPVQSAPPAAAMAADTVPALGGGMKLSAMILYERHSATSSRAAQRMAARLDVLHVAASGTRIVAVSGTRSVAAAGVPGIGYFYEEDRAGAETLRRLMPDVAGGVRLIAGPARAAQQPGTVAIVIPWGTETRPAEQRRSK